jgi:NADPH:quinone reductase-like Zn-dependent oxidoreductase
MRALTTMRYGPPEVLAVRERPDPNPGPGEVCIRVERAGLNFADLAARVGLYPDAPKPPMVMGYEVAGTVTALGAGASGLPVGTRVLALTRFGGQATHALADVRYVIPLPQGMTMDQAAALPVNWSTAHHMLHRVGHLQPGQTLLVHMAAGGVGLAAIALARMVEGVRIFGTASAIKHALLRQAGVDHPIDYRTQDYVVEVKRLTAGRGLDLILDAVGGPEWSRNYGLLAPAGQLICFGWAQATSGETRNYLHLARGILGTIGRSRESTWATSGESTQRCAGPSRHCWPSGGRGRSSRTSIPSFRSIRARRRIGGCTNERTWGRSSSTAAERWTAAPALAISASSGVRCGAPRPAAQARAACR